MKWALRDLHVNGNWNYDNSVFRLFRWYAYAENEADSVKWVEYSDTTDWLFNLDPCRLIWIKTRKPVTLHLGKGITASLKRSYTILAAPGTWSDVALPYSFSIRIGDIIDSTNDNPANMGSNKGEALSFYYWDIDSTNQYRCRPKFLANFGDAEPSLSNKADSISKDEAGFTVYNSLEAAVTLSIPPIPAAMSKFGSTNNLGKKNARQTGWAVRISGKTAGGMLLSEVYCGYSEGKPGMTYYPIPTLFSGIGIRACDDRNRKYGHALAQGQWDKESGATYALAFSNASENTETIDYIVESVQRLPEKVRAAIFDYSTGVFDSASRPLPITLAKGETVYRRLAVGTEEYLRKVKQETRVFRLGLGATVMNPFTHTMKIRFSLPYAGVSRVRFSIIDIMGRVVWEHSLSCGRAAGMQEYIWNGRTKGLRPVVAGIYILRMAAFDETRNPVGTFEKKIPYLP